MTRPLMIPRSLPYRGGTITLAGRGREPGCHLYMDLRQGTPVEVYLGQVVQSGPIFAQVEVKNNTALRRVRVDNHLLANGGAEVGDSLLIGPIFYAPEGPRSQSVWRLRVAPARPAPVDGRNGAHPRRKGLIVWVAEAGTYGHILPNGSQERVFVHISNLRPGVRLWVGQPVVFDLARNDRGPTAFNVGLA